MRDASDMGYSIWDTYAQWKEFFASLGMDSYRAWLAPFAMGLSVWFVLEMLAPDAQDVSPTSSAATSGAPSSVSSGTATPLLSSHAPVGSVDHASLLATALDRLARQQSESQKEQGAMFLSALERLATSSTGRTQSQSEIDRMMTRLDRFEDLLKRDSGLVPARPQAGTPQGSASSWELMATPIPSRPMGDLAALMGVTPPASPGLASPRPFVPARTPVPALPGQRPDEIMVPCWTTLPRGNEESGEVTIPGAATEMPMINPMAERLIQEIQAVTASAHSAFSEELKRYQPISEKEWPLPPGYRARVAPAFLAFIYARAESGEKYGKKYLEDHGLGDCFAAQEIVRVLGHFDRLLTSDMGSSAGWINVPTTEYLARRAYGLMEAFRDCSKKVDWCRDSKNKQWRSKVNWRRCDRLDPKAKGEGLLSLPDVEGELKTAEMVEIDKLKVAVKLAEREKQSMRDSEDLLNPHLGGDQG